MKPRIDYRKRERAALGWTEAITQISQEHVSEEVYGCPHQHFSEKELVDLTLAIIAINGWNRLAINFRSVPGSYQQPAHRRALTAATSDSGSKHGRDASSRSQ